MTGVLTQIRARTGSIHQRLEQRLLLTHSPLSRAAYACYLARLGGVVRATELYALSSPTLQQLLPHFPERSGKSQALLADLDELGLPGMTSPLMPLPCTTPSGLFGLLYVMEGSTLGGVVLARTLEAELGPLPTRYLRYYGQETGPKWRGLVAALEAFGRSAAGAQLPRDAALMFTALEAWLESGGLLSPREEQTAWPPTH